MCTATAGKKNMTCWFFFAAVTTFLVILRLLMSCSKNSMTGLKERNPQTMLFNHFLVPENVATKKFGHPLADKAVLNH